MSDTTNQFSELDRYVEEHVQTSLTELARLCSQPSVSAQGIGMQSCADLLAELLRAHGIATQVMKTPGYPIIVGEVGTEITLSCSTITMMSNRPSLLSSGRLLLLSRRSGRENSLHEGQWMTKDTSFRGSPLSMRIGPCMENSPAMCCF